MDLFAFLLILCNGFICFFCSYCACQRAQSIQVSVHSIYMFQGPTRTAEDSDAYDNTITTIVYLEIDWFTQPCQNTWLAGLYLWYTNIVLSLDTSAHKYIHVSSKSKPTGVLWRFLAWITSVESILNSLFTEARQV